jgi:hypothetical protein
MILHNSVKSAKNFAYKIHANNNGSYNRGDNMNNIANDYTNEGTKMEMQAQQYFVRS